MRKIWIIVLSVVLCTVLCSCKEKKELKDDIYIFFTSDVHCGVDEGMEFSGLKALVEETKAEHEYVSLVDCGDFVQGGAIGTLSKGELVIELMNEAGYDLVTFGNHEFDYGVQQLGKLISQMEFEPLLCNVRYTGKNDNIFENVKPYRILEYGDFKVAFIGVLTPRTRVSSTPAYFMEDGEFVYDFYGGEDGNELCQRVQESVDEVRKQGADYVILLSHLGSEDVFGPYDSISLIHKTSGIDAVLDGHSHSLIVEDRYPNKNNEDVILSSVGTKLQSVGELIIGKDGSLSVVHIEEYDQKDEAMSAFVDQAFVKLDEILSVKICDLSHDMKITDEEGVRMVRCRETSLGDFVADALRYTLDCDIGIINGGGVRADVDAGSLTYGDLLRVMPFQNELSSCYASGQQIVDALEFASMNTSGIYKLEGNPVGEFGAFCQVSGLKYTVDTSVETPVLLDEERMFAGFGSGERRVKDVVVLENGDYVPIDLNKMYSVASIDYVLFKNGDGNRSFADCVPIVSNGGTDINALIEYAKSIDDFSDKYLQAGGRILVQ